MERKNQKEFPAQPNSPEVGPQGKSPINQIVGGFKKLFSQYIQTQGDRIKENIPDATDEQDCINKANYIGSKIDEHGEFRSENELVQFLTELFQTLKMRRLGTNDEDRASQTTALNIKMDGNEITDNSFKKVIKINGKKYHLDSNLAKLYKNFGTPLSLFTYDNNGEYREIMNYSLETNLADTKEIARKNAEEELNRITNSAPSASAAKEKMERETRERLSRQKFEKFRRELVGLTRDQLSTDLNENLNQILEIAAKHELDEYWNLQDAQVFDIHEFIDTQSKRQRREFKFDVTSNNDQLQLGHYTLKFTQEGIERHGIRYYAMLYGNGSNTPIYTFS